MTLTLLFSVYHAKKENIFRQKNRQGTERPNQNQKLRSIIIAAVLGVSLPSDDSVTTATQSCQTPNTNFAKNISLEAKFNKW